MKKFIVILISIVMLFSLVGCGAKEKPKVETEVEVETVSTVKMGLICLHDENSTYDNNFINSFKAACEATNTDYIIKTNVPEGQECYEAACELIDDGCTTIFADSFGHEDFMVQAAREYPDIQFCHATGVQAHTEGLSNYHNAFAAIYEGRYIDGIAAGLKLQEMGAESGCVGYVGAYPYAEVISGYSAFYLGVKSVCPDATMKVVFTNSWYDEAIEREAATMLIESGCVLISGHADSMGIPTACENTGVPFVFYNGSVAEACPNTFIVSTRINWEPYFLYLIDCANNSQPIDTDWTGTIADGSVVMSEVNANVAAEGTEIAIADAITQFANGELDVFDTRMFTIGGEVVDSYMADVDFDNEYTGDTEVIENGVFMESKFRSAPYFDLAIDGIEVIG